MGNNSRTILAIFLSLGVLLFWQIFLAKPATKKQQRPIGNSQIELPILESKVAVSSDKSKLIQELEQETSRIPFQNKLIKGSINLQGARIDDLTLKTYKDNNKNLVDLLSPDHNRNVYYAEFGWVTFDRNIELPDARTVWQADKQSLKAGSSVNIFWYNKDRIKFLITISIDQGYMFTIEQSIIGLDSNAVKAYSSLSRSDKNIGKSEMLIHQGAIGVFRGQLSEISYNDLNKEHIFTYRDNAKGWLGFSDKYWLAALIPTDGDCNARFTSHKNSTGQRYQAGVFYDYDQHEHTTNKQRFLFYAGAKKLNLLDNYAKEYNIDLFDRAVDFGVLYFITKPIFQALNFFNSLVGNFGVAILILTVLIKLLLFPLAYKGFKGMSKLKDLQPEIKRLKDTYAGDNIQLQKSMLNLYKKAKINPMSGCLPMLLQMPVFFALYKVLYVTIEMRQAPFFGWIKDLSAPDPTNLFNISVLIPFGIPSFIHLGILPILMAGTLFLQQSLNPQPTDPTQAKIMKYCPLIFLFMIDSFPSGLVLYWTWSNVLSILQQIVIKRMSK